MLIIIFIISIVAIALAGVNQFRILRAGSISEDDETGSEKAGSSGQGSYVPEEESKTYLNYIYFSSTHWLKIIVS